MKFTSNKSMSEWPAGIPSTPFKAYVPNGVVRDKGKGPRTEGQQEATCDSYGGWKGNQTGE